MCFHLPVSRWVLLGRQWTQLHRRVRRWRFVRQWARRRMLGAPSPLVAARPPVALEESLSRAPEWSAMPATPRLAAALLSGREGLFTPASGASSTRPGVRSDPSTGIWSSALRQGITPRSTPGVDRTIEELRWRERIASYEPAASPLREREPSLASTPAWAPASRPTVSPSPVQRTPSARTGRFPSPLSNHRTLENSMPLTAMPRLRPTPTPAAAPAPRNIPHPANEAASEMTSEATYRDVGTQTEEQPRSRKRKRAPELPDVEVRLGR